jgi:curli biogenesis system outer membrane secretion channel CsgG
MELLRKIACVMLVISLVACGDKKEAPKDTPKKTVAEGIKKTPDVGSVEQVDVSAKGVGITPGAAINEALKTAIMQVNGTVVSSVSANLNSMSKVTADVDVQTSEGKDSAKVSSVVQGSQFAEAIISKSGGVVSSFKVNYIVAPEKAGGTYNVEITAKIAKFKAPADAGKIKIVIAPIRSAKPTFNIGGREVPASQVLDPVRQQLIDALTQSGRFTILDRQFNDELQKEMDLISSGQTNNADIAKLGQALSADLVWVGVVNNLAYEKNVRKLQTSDRSLVSYGGAWSISQRLINMATRQIMLSNTLSGKMPSIAPTTMGANFNETNLLKNLQEKVTKTAVESIMLRTFPISIVEIDGTNVVLSQGEGSVHENDRYKVYMLGKEIKDPQTGQSLGNMETPFGEVVITRVTPKVSYGRLENVQVNSTAVQPGSLQIREAVQSKKPEKPQASSGDSYEQKKVGKQKTSRTMKKDDDW